MLPCHSSLRRFTFGALLLASAPADSADLPLPPAAYPAPAVSADWDANGCELRVRDVTP